MAQCVLQKDDFEKLDFMLISSQYRRKRTTPYGSNWSPDELLVRPFTLADAKAT